MSTPELPHKAVLFADLRGSTGLYEEMGNANATLLVTRSVASLAETVHPSGGRLIKTLGDGLMAVFDDAAGALQSAVDMHERIERASRPTRGFSRPPASSPPSAALRALRLQVSVAMGEVAEVGGDYFGDAVNVAARLLDHAGDGETLITDAVRQQLAPRIGQRFRNLDWVHLRGRAEPVLVHVLGGRRSDSGAVTQFEDLRTNPEPSALRLVWKGKSRLLSTQEMPIVLGRSSQSIIPLEDPRVSRLHARIDWHGSTFHLSDLSFNGTSLRFDGRQLLSLRRTECNLHGRGEIGLAGVPGEPGVPTLEFEVLDFSDTQPHGNPETRA